MFNADGQDVAKRFTEALLSQPPTANNLISAKRFLLANGQALRLEDKARINDYIELAKTQLEKAGGNRGTILDEEVTRIAMLSQQVSKAQLCLTNGQWSPAIVFMPGQQRVRPLGTIKHSSFGRIKRGVMIQPDPGNPGKYNLTDSKVAIKYSSMELTLTGRRTTGELIFENAEREMAIMNILARFNHPYLLSLMAVGRDDSNFIMLTPLGKMSVWDHVQNFKLDNLLSYVHRFRFQVGAALTFLHALGFAHRDVSLENVLEMDDGSFRLIDFGLAKPLTLIDADNGQWQNIPLEQRDGRVFAVGKLRYLAPEFFQRDVDMRSVLYDATKSDVFSFGICIFVLAYRAFPHQHIFRDALVEPTVPQLLSFWNDHVRDDFFALFRLDAKLEWLKPMLAKHAHVRPSARNCVETISYVDNVG